MKHGTVVVECSKTRQFARDLAVHTGDRILIAVIKFYKRKLIDLY